MAQGREKTNLPGTNTIVFTKYENIPLNRRRDITYGRIVVDFRPNKDDPYRTRMTVGGNLINYPDVVTTKTAELTTAKLHLNSVISTANARYLTADVGNFYLNTEMTRYEYMFLPLNIIPEEIIQQYQLRDIASNGKVYIEIQKGMYGLPQAGIIANKKLQKILQPHGYYPCKNTAGLWRHVTNSVTFTLVVDDFGIKYVGKEYAGHILQTLCHWYEVAKDWSGERNCGITIEWDYEKGHVDLSMPGYICNVLMKFQHAIPKHRQDGPQKHILPQYGQTVQYAIKDDPLPLLAAAHIKKIHAIIGCLLYYAR